MVKKAKKIVGYVEDIKKGSLFDVKTQVGARKSIASQQQVFSGEQGILRGMFGGGVGKRILGDVRPRINKTLQGGSQPFGLIKNQDGGYTASLMLPNKSGRRTL